MIDLNVQKSDLVKVTELVSPAGTMSKADWKKYAANTIQFVAPTLSVFFAQLALGVSWKPAMLVAALALWQSLRDLFNKISDGPKQK